MRRDKKRLGIFVAFGYTSQALKEIRRAEREDGIRIQAITVREILESQAA